LRAVEPPIHARYRVRDGLAAFEGAGEAEVLKVLVEMVR